MARLRVVVPLDIEYGWACVYVCIHMHTTHIHTYIDVFTGGLCPSSGFFVQGGLSVPYSMLHTACLSLVCGDLLYILY